MTGIGDDGQHESKSPDESRSRRMRRSIVLGAKCLILHTAMLINFLLPLLFMQLFGRWL